jgi:hypothetical protein
MFDQFGEGGHALDAARLAHFLVGIDADRAADRNLPDRAGTAPAVSKGTAFPVTVSQSSGFLLAASRR